MDIGIIKKFIKEGRLALKRHMALRIHQRNLRVAEIEEALINGEIIEDYSKTEPLPSYLVLGFTKTKRPIHIVIAVDPKEKMVWAITAYEPNLMEWERSFKKRSLK